MMSRFHDGELDVQRRAGVSELAERVGRSIGNQIAPAAQAFLQSQPMLVLAAADDQGAIWASLLTGEAGFARALDSRHVRIDRVPFAGDPLHEALPYTASVGLLAIDLSTRR